jgi:prepilin-type N-terminal cleavage/methylation domain-containing protein
MQFEFLKKSPRLVMSSRPLAESAAGFTLLECLVAIAIIALTAAVIAPALVLAVATRVQSQRAEQALGLAQAEIDRVRLIVERGGDYGATLASIPVTVTTASSATLVSAPTLFQVPASSTAVTSARPVNIDQDADNEYAVQLFRTQGIQVPAVAAGAPSTPVAFQIGVRVYDFSRGQANLGNLRTNEAALGLTSNEGEGNRRPLAVLYTDIAQSDRLGALCRQWQFLNPGQPLPPGLICN